jgi:hypothetical protein
MTEGKSGEPKGGGLSLEKAAKMLGISKERVEILAGQGRLKSAETKEGTRYDLDSVLSMQAENLIREMLEEAGDKRRELQAKIDTLAVLQYQRGREGAQRAEHWEILKGIEKANAEAKADREHHIAQLQEMNEASEQRLEEMRALVEEMRAIAEGRLRHMPSGGGRRETG